MEEQYTYWGTRFTLSGLEIKSENQAFITVSREHTVPFITFLKDIEGYTHLVFFTAVDMIEDDHFRLLYMIHNYTRHHDIGVQVEIPRINTSMESIHHLWPHAATYQRELKEMYGVDFPGSPGVNDSFALEGWEGIPPMRRDFDSKEYSEKTFYPRPGRETHDPAEHMKKKLYPGEAETW